MPHDGRSVEARDVVLATGRRPERGVARRIGMLEVKYPPQARQESLAGRRVTATAPGALRPQQPLLARRWRRRRRPSPPGRWGSCRRSGRHRPRRAPRARGRCAAMAATGMTAPVAHRTWLITTARVRSSMAASKAASDPRRGRRRRRCRGSRSRCRGGVAAGRAGPTPPWCSSRVVTALSPGAQSMPVDADVHPVGRGVGDARCRRSRR